MPAFMTHSYSECTYKMSGFHAASDDKIQLTENWRMSGVCPSFTDVEQQQPLYSASRIIAGGTADRKITILQMNIYIYISLFQHNALRNGRVCLRHAL
jgi:hypothetical protein